jgi:endoglucanase
MFWSAAAVALLSVGGQALAATQVPAARLALLSRGINADNLVNNIRLANYDDVAIAKLTSMGFTYVRIPIDPSWIIQGAPVDYQKTLSSATRAAQGLARLDQYVAKFISAGLAVDLCIQPQKKLMNASVTQSEDIIRKSVAVIAKRYAGKYSPNQLFFEELNEPHYTWQVWNQLQPQLLSIIRQSAPQHTVIIPSAWNDLPQNFKYLVKPNDLNVVYTMHIYQPAKLTEQGSLLLPLPNYRFPRPLWSTDPSEWTYTKLHDYIQPAINWAKANNVPLTMTEFGAATPSDRTSRLKWISYVRQTAESNHIGWSWWSFDGALFGLRPLGGAFNPDLVQLLSN